jgi:hypothetical protein
MAPGIKHVPFTPGMQDFMHVALPGLFSKQLYPVILQHLVERQLAPTLEHFSLGGCTTISSSWEKSVGAACKLDAFDRLRAPMQSKTAAANPAAPPIFK